MKQKDWSGERLETHIFTETTTEHLHRYALSIEYVKNKIVLDIASGEGYGSNILSQYAKYVTGVDICEETVKNANQKYLRPNLIFKKGSTSQIPLEDNSVDVVISFETIEHHDQHDEMMLEIKRVLNANGVLIISTPDKKNYTDLPNVINPHHIKELYLEEFKTLMNKYFVYTEFGFQKMFTGSIIERELSNNNLNEYYGDFKTIKRKSDFGQIYIVCVASDVIVTELKSSSFDGYDISQMQSENKVIRIRRSWSYKIGKFILRPFNKPLTFFNVNFK